MAVSHLLRQQKHNTEGLHAKFGFRDILLGLDIYLSFLMSFILFDQHAQLFAPAGDPKANIT